jgi:hypothetical protein
MQQLDSYLADRVLTRQLYLMRFSAGEKKKVLAVLVDMRAELVAKLQNGFTPYEKTRLTKLLKDCTAIINTFYGGIQSEFDYAGLAKAEAAATQTAIASKGLKRPYPRRLS